MFWSRWMGFRRGVLGWGDASLSFVFLSVLPSHLVAPPRITHTRVLTVLLPIFFFLCFSPPSTDMDQKNKWGTTALIDASYWGRTAIVDALIAADGSTDHIRMKVRFNTRGRAWLWY